MAVGLLVCNPRQLAVQATAVLAAAAYSAVGTMAVLKLVTALLPLRTSAREEGLGLDISQHGEEAYTRGEGAILVLPDVASPAPAPASRPQLEPEGGRA